MKQEKLNLEFYINPTETYMSHKLNILKECLTEWSKDENSKFYPNWKNFKFSKEQIETKVNNIITGFHCYTSKSWAVDHKLFDELYQINIDLSSLWSM